MLVLTAYTLVRAVFLAAHAGLYAETGATAVAGAFLRGLRFDLSAIAYTNIPFVLLALAPSAWLSRPWVARGSAAAFVLVNAAAIILMVGDVVYYDFTGTRVTFDLLDLTAEGTAQLDQLLLNYWPFTVVMLLLVGGLALLLPRAHGPLRRQHWALALPTALLLLGGTVLAARGGLQRKPLNPIHAFAQGDHELGILALNSVFTLVQSPLRSEVQPVTFYRDDAEAERVLQAPFGFAAHRTTPPPNVVVIILESFATEFWGAAGSREGLTPFLDSLVPQGRFFRHNYANGRRSIDALPSILLGVPLLMTRSIALSTFQGNEWVGLGHLMERGGYHTSMFHGAPKGTMYFDAIARMAGIREFYSMERYPAAWRDRDFDGHWGLYDEPFLRFTAEELGRLPQPFFSTIFTISTHQPYRVPPHLVDSLPAGTQEIHRSVRYVDQSLGRFFAYARTQPWYDHTLFVITGDHTQSLRGAAFETPLGRYMVPLLLFQPGRPLPPTDPDRITQHVDILPTLLDVAGIDPGEIPRFGRSVFSPADGEAILGANGYYWLVRRDGVLQREPDGREALFPYAAEASLTAAAGAAAPTVLASRLHAHVQHFNNSLLQNSFYRSADAAARGSAQ
jgi:uncharacterized sulfatase